jgi:hypothetical protein
MGLPQFQATPGPIGIGMTRDEAGEVLPDPPPPVRITPGSRLSVGNAPDHPDRARPVLARGRRTLRHLRCRHLDGRALFDRGEVAAAVDVGDANRVRLNRITFDRGLATANDWLPFAAPYRCPWVMAHQGPIPPFASVTRPRATSSPGSVWGGLGCTCANPSHGRRFMQDLVHSQAHTVDVFLTSSRE